VEAASAELVDSDVALLYHVGTGATAEEYDLGVAEIDGATSQLQVYGLEDVKDNPEIAPTYQATAGAD